MFRRIHNFITAQDQPTPKKQISSLKTVEKQWEPHEKNIYILLILNIYYIYKGRQLITANRLPLKLLTAIVLSGYAVAVISG